MTEQDSRDQVTVEFLERFLDVWNRHDLDGILAALEPDCVYLTSSGVRLDGQEAIRQGLAGFLETYPDAHWRDARHFVSGGRGASEWVFTATGPDGAGIVADACDLFTFRNGRIATVSAFLRRPGA